MTLPSFTAETSLYRTSGQYRTARAHHQMKGTVYPAQSNRAECTTYTTMPVTYTDCCNPDPYLPDCWRCSRSDSSGYVLETWDQGDGCSPPPRPCTPSSTWKWVGDCKVWTLIDENCRETTEYECFEPLPKPKPFPEPLVILKG